MAIFWKTGGTRPDFFFSFGKEEKQVVLYLSNIGRGERLYITPELFSAEFVAVKNISETKYDKGIVSFKTNVKEGSGGAIILLSSLSCKEFLEADKIYHSSEVQNKMKIFLAEENIFDFSSSEVKNVVSQVINRLSLERKRNPYWQVLSALDWAHWNIKYSRVTRETIQQLEKTLHAFPNDSVCSLLRNSFTWNELPVTKNILGKLSEDIILPKYANTPFDKARYILNEFDQKYPILFRRWEKRKYLSASKTICDGTGKCDCIVHVFVSLCRSMGIPAIKIDQGYLHPQGWHAWALVYLHPYGWVEVDPTNNFCFGRFNHDTHLYHFIREPFIGEVHFLTTKKPITKETLNACKYFYEQSSVHPNIEKLIQVHDK